MFIFMHFPKTAGTSFNSFLFNNIQPEDHTFIDEPLEISVISDEKKLFFESIYIKKSRNFHHGDETSQCIHS